MKMVSIKHIIQTNQPPRPHSRPKPEASHDSTRAATQLLEQPRKELLDRLLDLVALLLLATMVLLPSMMLSTMLGRLVSPMLLPRISRSRIPTMLSTRLDRQRRRAGDGRALEIDVYPTLIRLRRILQPQLAAHLLDPGLDPLDMVRAVVALPDNHMQVRLPARLGVLDARLEDVLSLLDELPVQVDRVVGDAPGGVVLAEDILGGLLIVCVHLGAVLLALVGEGFGLGAIAALVCLAGLWREGGSVWKSRAGSRGSGEMYAVETGVPLPGLLPG